MADTKDFDVIRPCRSDGADSGPGYWPVAAPAPAGANNAAKKAVAEKAPRAKPQMTRLAEDDPRFVEFRVKLGILLKQELSPHPDEGNSWYVQFPNGYWLYERSKHLWVSGYPIKAKLFKTPQEFALHLIWLLSSSMDYKDCCCVHCNLPSLPRQSSTGDETPTLVSASPVKPEKAPPKVTPVPLPQIPGQPHLKATPAAPQRKQPSPKPPSTSTSPMPTAAAPASAPPKQSPALAHASPQQAMAQPQHQTHPQVQAQPQTQDHLHAQMQQQQQQPPPQQQQQQQQQQPQQAAMWTLKSSLLFRVGELVWFKNGATWRLGVIRASDQTGHSHEIVPIGHGMYHHRLATKSTEDMRPFLAFSVPPVTVGELKDKVYDEIPWQEMLEHASNENNQADLLALDASKMAASKIDYSFSLWSPLAENQGKNTLYYGCFCGAERVEVGDSLRLKNLPRELGVAAETAILGLGNIFTSTDYPGTLLFGGHIYMLVKGDVPNAMPPENLPLALQDEINWRNSVSKSGAWRWVLVKDNVVLKEACIRGRFYPTHRLMPILHPAQFQHAVQQGQLDDVLAQLNNRMEGGHGRYIGRKINRLDTLGPAVVHDAKLGLEPHVKEAGWDGSFPR